MGVIYAPQNNSGGGIGDTIGTLAQLACMVIPGAQVALPFIAAGKAINSAANGNWGGAAANAIGAYNGFSAPQTAGVNSNAINNSIIQASNNNLANNGLSSYALGSNTLGNSTQVLDGGTSYGKLNLKDVWK